MGSVLGLFIVVSVVTEVTKRLVGWILILNRDYSSLVRFSLDFFGCLEFD